MFSSGGTAFTTIVLIEADGDAPEGGAVLEAAAVLLVVTEPGPPAACPYPGSTEAMKTSPKARRCSLGDVSFIRLSD